MVNAVSESGNYWVANNFIWGWLLIPVTCFCEILKKNNLEKLTFKNTWRFSIAILLIWVASMPLWSWFMRDIMKSDSSVISSIVLPLIPFYITYIVSTFIDSWFISKGLTIYNSINSFVVNVIYYGILYCVYLKGYIVADMSFIVNMFGFGMVVHLIVSWLLYLYQVKFRKNVI